MGNKSTLQNAANKMSYVSTNGFQSMLLGYSVFYLLYFFKKTSLICWLTSFFFIFFLKQKSVGYMAEKYESTSVPIVNSSYFNIIDNFKFQSYTRRLFLISPWNCMLDIFYWFNSININEDLGRTISLQSCSTNTFYLCCLVLLYYIV